MRRWTGLAGAAHRAVRRLDAGEGAQELHLAVALGAGDADDLAAAELRSTGPNRRPRSWVTWSSTSSLASTVGVGEGVLERAADHQRDDVGLGHRVGVERALADAVAQDRDAVGDVEHLGEAVADVDDGDAGRRRACGSGRAAARRRRGRAPWSARRAAAPSAATAAPGRPRASAAGRATGSRSARRRQMSSSYSASFSAAHASIRPYRGRSAAGAARNRFSATVRPATSVIVWYAMPRPSCIAALGEADVSGSPAISTMPVSGGDGAAGDAEQRRLARAVLAEEGVDLAGVEVDRDVVVGLHRPVALRDLAQREHGASPAYGSVDGSTRPCAVVVDGSCGRASST